MREWINDEEKNENEYYEVGIFEVIHPKRRLKINELIRRGKILRSHAHDMTP